MPVDDFHALTVGTLRQPDATTVTLQVRDLGHLAVPSGRLAACDPFVTLTSPFVTSIDPGTYPVRVTVADVSEHQDGSHLREAFLTVVLAEGEVAAVEPATSASDGAPPPGEWFVVEVDAGTVAFVDASEIRRGMPEDPGRWYDEVFDSGRSDSWFALMDAEDDGPAGTANLRLPRSPDANLVLSHSGWGDGTYPVVVTRDLDGRMLGVHLDLLVVSPEARSISPPPP